MIWYIIQGTENERPLAKLSPFIIDKALKAAVGELKTVKRLQRGMSSWRCLRWSRVAASVSSKT